MLRLRRAGLLGTASGADPCPSWAPCQVRVGECDRRTDRGRFRIACANRIAFNHVARGDREKYRCCRSVRALAECCRHGASSRRSLLLDSPDATVFDGTADSRWASGGHLLARCSPPYLPGERSGDAVAVATCVVPGIGRPSNCSARPRSKNSAAARHTTAPTAPQATIAGARDLRRDRGYDAGVRRRKIYWRWYGRENAACPQRAQNTAELRYFPERLWVPGAERVVRGSDKGYGRLLRRGDVRNRWRRC